MRSRNTRTKKPLDRPEKPLEGAERIFTGTQTPKMEHAVPDASGIIEEYALVGRVKLAEPGDGTGGDRDGLWTNEKAIRSEYEHKKFNTETKKVGVIGR